MSCQAQSVSRLISHFPCEEPPQGPFNNCLAQRAIGHIPAVFSRRQSPQAWQRSSHTPCATVSPMNLVFTPGNICFAGKWRASVCTPPPEEGDGTAAPAPRQQDPAVRDQVFQYFLDGFLFGLDHLVVTPKIRA